MKTHKQGSGGFTLVELIVVIAISGFITTALTTVVNGYLHLWQQGRYLSLSSSYVESKVEALRNAGYNSIAPGTTNLTTELPAQLPPKRSAQMTVSSPSAGLKQVDITVTYNDQGQNKTYGYTTLIGELGVGQ